MGCAAAIAAPRADGERKAFPQLWLLFALGALAQPIMLNIWLLVQPAPLVTLAWAAFALCWMRDRRGWAALCVVAGAAVKPHLMVGPALLVAFGGPWRARYALAAGATALVLGAWTLIGGAGLRHYPEILALSANSAHWSIGAFAMPNLRGLLTVLFSDTPAVRVTTVLLSILILAGVAWAARAGSRSPETRAAPVMAALSGGMLASYHMHIQELPGLFVLVALCAAAGWLPAPRVASAVFALNAALWITGVLWVLWRPAPVLMVLAIGAAYGYALISARAPRNSDPPSGSGSRQQFASA
jgi:hypothetical protein